jgi:hypothetical protein
MGGGKCGNFATGRIDPYDRWIGREIETVASGVKKLRHEADVGEARPVAVAKTAGVR